MIANTLPPPDPNRTLHRLIGLPRSGKTTWAVGTGWPIVNPDSIRVALHGLRFYAPAEPLVWAIAKMMVQALFMAGHVHVIIDATNTTEKRREQWDSLVEGTRVVDHVMMVPPWICVQRALEQDDTEILPVIARMAKEWDYPLWRWNDSDAPPEAPEVKP